MKTPDDDERTVIKGVSGAADELRSGLPGEYADALPAATRLHEFEIMSVIGQGGFGIVYLAHDLTLDRRVAIKEYMPSALATRTQAMTVAVRSGRHTETFAAGLRSFINEARLLARFDHPSLLKVHRFWEAHGTAYMVMPYYEGITLAKLLTQLGGPPDEARLKTLLHPLLDALELLHAAHCYHRDIAPDNILILPDGRPLLLDFGAARRVIGDLTQALTVILKTGYAPVEQYGELPGLSQGAWTDLYALGSVVQFAITGHTPPPAVARFLADKRSPLAVIAAGRYSDAFLRAIDRSLAVLPKDRPQSVAEMRKLMGTGSVPPAQSREVEAVRPAAAAASAATVAESTSQRQRASAPRDAGDDATVPRPALPPVGVAAEVTPPRKVSSAPPRVRSRALVLGSLALGAMLVAAGSVWFGVQRPKPVEGAASVSETHTPGPAAVAPQAAPPGLPTIEAAPSEMPAQAAQEAPFPPAAEPPAALPSPESAGAAEAGAGARAAEVSRPAGIPTARAARAATPEARPAQRIASRKSPSARCADIVQRVSLGEELSNAEKAFLKQECGP